MKNSLLLFLVCLTFWLTRCFQERAERNTDPINKSHSDLLLEVQHLRDSLAQNAHILDKSIALEFIMKSEAYAMAFPSSPYAPETIFRAADVARGIEEYELAIDLWSTLRNTFSDSPLAPEALFMISFTLDNNLNRDSLAAARLDSFLFLYPEHRLAKDAKVLRDQLGKDEQDLIEMLNKQ